MAAIWLGISSVCSATGLIHAYRLTEKGIENWFAIPAAPRFAIAYALLAVLVWSIGRWLMPVSQEDDRDCQ